MKNKFKFLSDHRTRCLKRKIFKIQDYIWQSSRCLKKVATGRDIKKVATGRDVLKNKIVTGQDVLKNLKKVVKGRDVAHLRRLPPLRHQFRLHKPHHVRIFRKKPIMSEFGELFKTSLEIIDALGNIIWTTGRHLLDLNNRKTSDWILTKKLRSHIYSNANNTSDC